MRHVVIGVSLLASIGLADKVFADQEKPYDFEEKPWIESDTTVPDFPKQENLIEFYVGPTERNRFYVDGSTIQIGTDGIVRYVMVLKTPGGATNVTLEGMRCVTRETKLFALGRSDATWDKVDTPRWRPIENKTVNHYRAVLSRDLFCPAGHPPRDAADARAALRRGKHPDAPP